MALLKGLPYSVVGRVIETRLTLASGARTLVERFHRALGSGPAAASRDYAEDLYSVTVWGLIDTRSWRNDNGAPLLFDGALRAAPNMQGVAGFDRADHPLHPVALAEWRGFLFVNLAAEPVPFGEDLPALQGRFEHWPLPELRSVHQTGSPASSTYRLQEESGDTVEISVNYLTAKKLDVTFKEGAVHRVLAAKQVC